MDIELKDLVKVYGSGGNKISALSGVSFGISKGKLTVILGPSGSGKSTMLNILGGMDSPTSGSVFVEGRDIGKFNERALTAYRKKDIGFVFQFYNLMPNLTALENVQLCEGGEVGKGGLSAKETLSLVGLSHRLKNFPAQLSGGEQQRVSIARAIVKSPKLLLCDEPTGALDTKTGRNIIIMLQKIAREGNCAVVVVTHNTKLALAADRIIRLSDGLVVEDVENVPAMAEDIDF